MFKKILSLISVLTLTIGFNIRVFAVENEVVTDIFVEDNLVYIVYEEQKNLTTYGISTMSIETDTYTRDITVLVPNEETSAEEIVSTLGSGGSKTEYGNDSSISARATLTIEYEYGVSIRNTETILLTKVSGSCYALDSFTSIAEQKVAYACNKPLGGNSQTDSYTPTSASWEKNTPSSWVGVETADASLNACGARYEITLRRTNGYEWSFEILNNILEGTLPGVN